MEFIKLILIGIVIGIVNVIPGVSGGTMAVVFNIYDKFVDAITFNVKKLIKNWKFIVPLFLGILSGILLFSKVITILYKYFPVQTNNVFTGIIFGSIPMLYKYTTKSYKEEVPNRKFPSVVSILLIIAGFVLMTGFAYLENKFNGNTQIAGELPVLTLPLAVKLFFGGFLGAVAMIIPGISGSFLMLIIGIYPIVITGVASIVVPSTFVSALLILLPNGAGTLLGLLCGAKLMSVLIKKKPNQTYAVILGLILGSIVVVFPGFKTWNTVSGVIVSIICIAAGFALAYFSSRNEVKNASKETTISK